MPPLVVAVRMHTFLLGQLTNRCLTPAEPTRGLYSNYAERERIIWRNQQSERGHYVETCIFALEHLPIFTSIAFHSLGLGHFVVCFFFRHVPKVLHAGIVLPGR